MNTRFEVKGVSHTLQIFEDLRDQIGDAKKSSNILVKVAREAMKPVLLAAQLKTPEDTGLLKRSLTIVAGKPTGKDMRSNYVKPTDSAIAKVTTRPIPKHLKRAVQAKFGHLWASGKKAEFKQAKKKFYEEKNIFYDARAIANEFGTANRSAQPFLRNSLENRQKDVADLVGILLDQEIRNYISKNPPSTTITK
tara:strand:- start:196 stop:777 length:582 start_codon:yes stop_codon:yes gene_type:complete